MAPIGAWRPRPAGRARSSATPGRRSCAWPTKPSSASAWPSSSGCRAPTPACCRVARTDHFKRFNDQHGYAAGDALLAKVGQTLRELIRNEDVACRYGGEEFTLVLPETDRPSALRRTGEIRAAIGSSTVLHAREVLGPITASLGVAVFPEDAKDAATLLQLADAALYRAKHAGRNRVAMHGEPAL